MENEMENMRPAAAEAWGDRGAPRAPSIPHRGAGPVSPGTLVEHTQTHVRTAHAQRSTATHMRVTYTASDTHIGCMLPEAHLMMCQRGYTLRRTQTYADTKSVSSYTHNTRRNKLTPSRRPLAQKHPLTHAHILPTQTYLAVSQMDTQL